MLLRTDGIEYILQFPISVCSLAFLTKILYAFLISPMRDTCSPVLTDPPSTGHPNDITRAVGIEQLLIMQSSPAFCSFFLLRSKYFAQYSHSVKKVKFSRYRPGVAQRVDRGIALLFHDRGTRRGWMVSPTPRQHFTPRKDPVPILQETRWAPGPVWTGGKSRLHRDSILDRPARSQSLYRLSYPAYTLTQ